MGLQRLILTRGPWCWTTGKAGRSSIPKACSRHRACAGLCPSSHILDRPCTPHTTIVRFKVATWCSGPAAICCFCSFVTSSFFCVFLSALFFSLLPLSLLGARQLNFKCSVHWMEMGNVFPNSSSISPPYTYYFLRVQCTSDSSGPNLGFEINDLCWFFVILFLIIYSLHYRWVVLFEKETFTTCKIVLWWTVHSFYFIYPMQPKIAGLFIIQSSWCLLDVVFVLYPCVLFIYLFVLVFLLY